MESFLFFIIIFLSLKNAFGFEFSRTYFQKNSWSTIESFHNSGSLVQIQIFFLKKNIVFINLEGDVHIQWNDKYSFEYKCEFSRYCSNYFSNLKRNLVFRWLIFCLSVTPREITPSMLWVSVQKVLSKFYAMIFLKFNFFSRPIEIKWRWHFKPKRSLNIIYRLHQN